MKSCAAGKLAWHRLVIIYNVSRKHCTEIDEHHTPAYVHTLSEIILHQCWRLLLGGGGREHVGIFEEALLEYAHINWTGIINCMLQRLGSVHAHAKPPAAITGTRTGATCCTIIGSVSADKISALAASLLENSLPPLPPMHTHAVHACMHTQSINGTVWT